MSSNPCAPLLHTILAPVLACFQDPAVAAATRFCPAISDKQFVTEGALRALDRFESGRAFVQEQRQAFQSTTKISNYFEQIRSPRRLALLQALTASLRERALPALRARHDVLGSIPELAGREVWALDGHEISHACHDKARLSSGRTGKDGELGEPVERYSGVAHIYGMDVRTGWTVPVALCQGREHEMPTLKREDAAPLRVGGRKGAIWIYDPGGIDLGWWGKLKQQYGVYFISRMKTNMRPVHAVPIPWDRLDVRNHGVLADDRVGFNNRGDFRRVRYQDPETLEVHEFLTSEMVLPPGIIALLYCRRWDIEKTFDEFENKLGEDKAWATTAEAKQVQSHFLCLAHNLLLLQRSDLEEEHGIRDEKVIRKHEARVEARAAVAAALGRTLPPLLAATRRITQMSLQFLRWLRHHLRKQSSYAESLLDLRPFMESYHL